MVKVKVSRQFNPTTRESGRFETSQKQVADGGTMRKSGEHVLIDFVVFLDRRGDTERLNGCVEMLMANVEHFADNGFVLPNAVS